MVSFTSCSKTLLQFMLTLLPECGLHYLAVFHFLHSLCTAEGFLGPADQALLLAQLKLSHTEGVGETEGKGEEVEEEKGTGGGKDVVDKAEEEDVERGEKKGMLCILCVCQTVCTQGVGQCRYEASFIF